MVYRLDSSGIVIIDDAVFNLGNQLLQEPAGTHIPKAGRRIVLAAKERQEQRQELVPHHKLEPAIPGAIALDYG